MTYPHDDPTDPAPSAPLDPERMAHLARANRSASVEPTAGYLELRGALTFRGLALAVALALALLGTLLALLGPDTTATRETVAHLTAWAVGALALALGAAFLEAALD